ADHRGALSHRLLRRVERLSAGALHRSHLPALWAHVHPAGPAHYGKTGYRLEAQPQPDADRRRRPPRQVVLPVEGRLLRIQTHRPAHAAPYPRPCDAALAKLVERQVSRKQSAVGSRQEATRHAYLLRHSPRQTGLRFSRKALRPSRKSAVERMRAFSWRASSSSRSTSSLDNSRNSRLVKMRLVGLAASSSAASLRARSSSRPWGATSL